jgi:hypothetical protein
MSILNRSLILRALMVAVLAVGLHIFFGWMWSGIGALVVAVRWPRKSAWIGGIGVGSAWLILTFYNLLLAPSQVQQMTNVVANLVGNIPSATIIPLTVLIGALIGTSHGLLGGIIRSGNGQ